MAVEATPWPIQADSYSSEVVRRAVSALLGPAVGGLNGAAGGVVGTGDLQVSGTSGQNQVTVAAGQAFVPGTMGASQGLYYAYNNAAITNIAITPNGSNPLIAIVTLSVNDTAGYGGSGQPGVTSNSAGILVTQGTPSSSPAQPATPNNSLLLASILVPASAANSSVYTITDERVSIDAAPGGRMYPTGGTSLTSGSAALVTSMTPDYTEGGFSFSSNGLVVPYKGIYAVKWRVCYGGSGGGNISATGLLQTYLFVNGSQSRQTDGYAPVTNNNPTVSDSDDISLAAGQTLQLYALQSTGSAQRVVLGTEYTSLSATLLQRLP